jgi:hypothetical protein
MAGDLRLGKQSGNFRQFAPTEPGFKPIRSKKTCDCGHGVRCQGTLYLCDLWIKRNKATYSLKTPKRSAGVMFEDTLLSFPHLRFTSLAIALAKWNPSVDNVSTISEQRHVPFIGMFDNLSLLMPQGAGADSHT